MPSDRANHYHKAKRAEIDLVPLTQFSERIMAGWTMVAGYALQPGDYCVTMQPPGFPEPRRNVSRAAEHRNKVTQQKRRERLAREEALL